MKERPILFSGTRSQPSANGAMRQRATSLSLKPHISGSGTLDGVHEGGINGVIAAAEFLGNFVPHRLYERMSAINARTKRKVPITRGQLKCRAMGDVFTFLDYRAIRHNTSTVASKEIGARDQGDIFIAPLGSPVAAPLPSMSFGLLIAVSRWSKSERNPAPAPCRPPPASETSLPIRRPAARAPRRWRGRVRAVARTDDCLAFYRGLWCKSDEPVGLGFETHIRSRGRTPASVWLPTCSSPCLATR
ncbi:hypothetical protein B0G77_6770 [Paraburkholderia sp. BL10I2N1]|nr:hypothetical protein B0G77_6770 [Paraburkholderia sp. BL10I2N1]